MAEPCRSWPRYCCPGEQATEPNPSTSPSRSPLLPPSCPPTPHPPPSHPPTPLPPYPQLPPTPPPPVHQNTGSCVFQGISKLFCCSAGFFVDWERPLVAISSTFPLMRSSALVTSPVPSHRAAVLPSTFRSPFRLLVSPFGYQLLTLTTKT